MANFLGQISDFSGRLSDAMRGTQLNALAFDDPAAYSAIKTREEELLTRQRDRARQIEQQKRLETAMQNPEVLGTLSKTLNIPAEILSGISSFEELSELGRVMRPQSLGAIETHVQRLMAENPNLSYSDALAQVQTGYRQGVQFQGGTATPIQGLGTALGTLGGQEKYGTELGGLQAEAEMKPGIEADIVTAKKEAEYMAEGKQALPKIQRTLQSKELRNEAISDKIQQVKSQANPWLTGFSGSLASAVKGSPAYDLKANIETLVANAGFDRLQEMRDNSPTGGALGQVTERELSLLQAAEQNLLQSQSYEQFTANLSSFERQRQKSLENIRTAYDQDYKRFGGESDPNLPSPDQTFGTQKTVKRYNPSTGKIE